MLLLTTALAGCMQDGGPGASGATDDTDPGTGDSPGDTPGDTPDEEPEATVTKYLYKDQAEAARVQTLLNENVPGEHPEAAAFLKNFQIPGEDENNLMLKVAEAPEDAENVHKDVAVEYIENHPDMVAEWIADTGAETNPGEGRTLIIGMPNGWVGEMIRSYMVQKVLQDEYGYDAQIKSLDAGVIYQGLSTGDVQVFVGAWLPLQAAHYEKVKDTVLVHADNLPPESVSLSLAVPKYLYDQGIRSLADLDENRDLFDGKIHGIEPGAGMMITAKERTAEWDVYGLADWEIVDSSTPAMLAAYQSAVEDEEPIVIMMWQPHYAYAKWSGDQAVVDLEDPGWEVAESKLE